jgi:hypothetical protein
MPKVSNKNPHTQNAYAHMSQVKAHQKGHFSANPKQRKPNQIYIMKQNLMHPQSYTLLPTIRQFYISKIPLQNHD